MHRADSIIEIPSVEDFFHGVLIFEIANLNADLDRMIFFEPRHEIEIIFERVFKFVRLEPNLLKLSDERRIQNQIVVIKLLKFGESVRVLAYADFVKLVTFRRLEKTFDPSRVVVAVFKMHVIIKSHINILFEKEKARRIARAEKFSSLCVTENKFIQQVDKLPDFRF